MRKKSSRRIGRSFSPDTTIVVVGARPEDALAVRLRKAFAGAVFYPDLSAVEVQAAGLAIGIFEGSDEQSITGFAKWVHGTDAAGLSVMLGEHEVLIGPVSMAVRPGCGRCAWERMVAASDGKCWPARVLASPELYGDAGRALLREVRAIVRRGPEHSHLVDHVLAVDEHTQDAALHRIIPLAVCTVCGGAEAFPWPPHEALRLSPEDSPEFVLGALAGLVDPRTGVIGGVFLEPPIAAGLPIIATAAPPRVIDDDGSLRPLPLGWGKGLTVSGAVVSAVGEAIERYAASLPDQRRIIWERAQDLDGQFLDPRDLSLYTEIQYERPDFPYVRFDPSIRHPWIRGNWIGTSIPVWVPAVFAFLSFNLRSEHLICQGSSNGLAAGTDEDDAALRATLELVERDAFMTSWLTACPARRIQLDDTLDPTLRRVLDGIAALGATVEIYMLPTSQCGTTMLCLALGDGVKYPGATLGLGAALDSRSALRQAVLELGQTGPYLQRMMHSNTLPVPDDPGSVQEMLQHASYYFPAGRAAAFDRLRNDDAPIALCDLAEGGPDLSLSVCASQLEAAGVRVALVDVTSSDVATGPFRVVRAVSRDLQAIWYGYGLERQPVTRIRNLFPLDEIPAIHPIW